MVEKNMQTMYGKYLKQNPPSYSEVYELKICKNKSIPFNAVHDHQVEALINCATTQGLYWKLPDMSAKNGFSHQKPYDCQFLCKVRSYVVLWFYIPRKKKEFLKINIFDWQRVKKELEGSRKSLPEIMAREIAEEIINI